MSKAKYLGKAYRVYDNEGNEIVGRIIYAKNHNEAEKKARKELGENATVEYTEL